nr:antistasin [Haementeria officinalis]
MIKLAILLLFTVAIVRCQGPFGPGCEEAGCPEGSACNIITDRCTCSEVRCRVHCPHGFQRSRYGCEFCKCRLEPMKATCDISECPEGMMCSRLTNKCDCKIDINCRKTCPNGLKRDKLGCEYCECRPKRKLIPRLS